MKYVWIGLAIFTGVGIIGLGFFYIISQMNYENKVLEQQIQQSQQNSGGGGLFGFLGSAFQTAAPFIFA